MSDPLSSMLGGLDLRTTGRASKPLFASIDREMVPEDFVALQEERGTKPVAIKKLRQRHHGLAKALVDGIKDGEAGMLYGYTASHVSILKQDPSFKELLEFYAHRKDERYYELHDKIAALGEDAVDEITGRLEDEPEEFSIGQLLEVSKMALDRSGFGPQTSTNVNVNVGLADKLAEGRKRALEARAASLKEARMIDITPEDSDE